MLFPALKILELNPGYPLISERQNTFCIFDLQTDNNTLLEIRFIKNPFITLEKRKGLKAAQLLVGYKLDKLITKESIAQKSPFYVMDDACVESEVTDFDTIEMIIQDQLSSLPIPSL
jgi:predicted Fe-Mo cluster-binding NifX family protein